MTDSPENAAPITANPPATALLENKETRESPPASLASPTRLALLEGFLVVVVLLLGFFLVSFPAANSDLWQHLARGKGVFAGDFPFGWLYDLIVFGVHGLAGGAGLIVFKGLLVAGLGALLLRLGDTGAGLWMAAVGGAVALLTLGFQLEMQPVIFSLVFLALTLWFVHHPRPHRKPLGGPWVLQQVQPYWPLLVIQLLWVNCDSWFFLGPVVAGLVWLGQKIPAPRSPTTPGTAFLPGLVPVALVLVCLLNPHHVHALLFLPWQTLVNGSLTEGLSPFSRGYLVSSPGHCLTGQIYFLLVLLSLLSLGLNYAGWQWWRGLVWLVFFLLSVVDSTTIGLFAVAAGPLLAVNMQEFAARRRGRWVPAWSIRGRVVTILAGLALVWAAWPGWLQPPPFGPRRWSLEPNQSLVRLAAQLDKWHEEGLLDSSFGALNFNPNVGHYLAWYSPREKVFLDQRVVPSEAMADVKILRQGLLSGDGPPAPVPWREVLRRRHIHHLILADKELAVFLPRLLENPQEWPLLYWEGGVLVCGWQDPELQGKDRFARFAKIDLIRRAYDAGQLPAPPQGAPRWAKTPGVWDAFHQLPPPPSPERKEAALYLHAFDTWKDNAAWKKRHFPAWQNHVIASMVSGALPGHGMTLPGQGTANIVDMFLRASLLAGVPQKADRLDAQAVSVNEHLALKLGWEVFHGHLDDAPLELLWQAIRAARRALATNPDEAGAWLYLGEAYYRLSQYTRESLWYPEMPELAQLREIQAIVAFKQALRVQPRFPGGAASAKEGQENPHLADKAHERLYLMYRRLNYLDLAVEHLEGQWKAYQAAGPRPGETAQQAAKNVKLLEQEVTRRREFLQEKVEKFEEDADKARVVDRAKMAAQYGLAGKALTVLLNSDVSAFGAAGLHAEIHLLLVTGRLEEVQAWLTPEHQRTLLEQSYNWFKFYLAAAQGQYDRADKELDQMRVKEVTRPEWYDKKTKKHRDMPVHAALALRISQQILENCRRLSGGPPLLLNRDDWFPDQFRYLLGLMQKNSYGNVLRGLLALEAGNSAAAQDLFHEALASGPFGSRGRRCAQYWLQVLETSGK